MRTLIVVLTALYASGCAHYIRDDDAPRCHSASIPRSAGAIGLSLGRGPGHRMIVDRVASDGPAALADIRPGDRLVAIDGEATRDMSIREAARMIHGPVDTAVELRVRSPRGARLITLVRVPAGEVWGDATRGHQRGGMRDEADDDRGEAETAPPPVTTWPPTKPGHRLP